MVTGLGFIIISVGKLAVAIGSAVGFSNAMSWYHQKEVKSKKSESGKRVYQSSDIRERLNSIDR